MQSIRAIACMSGLAAAAWAQSEDSVRFPVCLKGAEGELVFTAERSSVLEAGNGYFVNGTLYLETPVLPMPIPKAEAYFEKDPGAGCMHTARGRAVPPTPISDTPLQSSGPVAEFGIDLGADLQKEFGIGLIEKRQYLFFNLDAGFDLQTVAAAEEDENAEPQAFEMQSGSGTKAKLLVDPLDPFYYVSGSVITPKKQPKPAEKDEDSKLVEFGTGASWQGLIPFRPTTTYGIENKARQFLGHRVKSGSFELVKMPVRITGYMVENINPLGHEKPAVDLFGIGYGPEAQMGANGIFDLSFKLLKSEKLKFLKSLDDIRLGTASAAFEVVQGAQSAYISGVFAPKLGNTFSKFIKLEAELKAMAYLSTAIDDTALAMNGLLYIAPGEFSQMAGISLNNFVHGEGSLSADRNGLFVKLLLENGSSLGPLSYRGRAQAELAVPSEEPENAALQIQGDTTFSGVTTTGITRISKNGLELTGSTTAPPMELTAAFRPDANGVLIEGSTTVPASVNTQIAGEITRTAAQVQSDLDKLLSDLEKATKDLDFEVSLRGLRTVIPGACDAVIRTLDARLRSEFNEAWPQIWVPFHYVDAPGKDAIWTIVNRTAEDYRQRIRLLKTTVQRGDDTATRAALKTAINDILANRRLRIEINVPVVNRRITFYNVELINDTLAAQLVTARTAVDRIPAVSNIRVSAQQAWTAAPKRAILLEVSKQIQQGISSAMPRIESLRFQTRPATTEWKFTAVTIVGGQRHNLTLTVPASDIANIGRAAGRELARILQPPAKRGYTIKTKGGCILIRTQTRTRWLLAVCGVLELATAAMNLLMLYLDGGTPNVVRVISVLAVAAGACAIAAGLWKSGSDNSWLLSLHGFALAAFGLIGLSPLVRGPLSFRPISLLFVLMAASIAAFQWKSAQALRPATPDRSLLSAAAAISICFALSFFAVGFNWVRLAAPYTFWIWMSSYFAFSAMFMLWLATPAHAWNARQSTT